MSDNTVNRRSQNITRPTPSSRTKADNANTRYRKSTGDKKVIGQHRVVGAQEETLRPAPKKTLAARTSQNLTAADFFAGVDKNDPIAVVKKLAELAENPKLYFSDSEKFYLKPFQDVDLKKLYNILQDSGQDSKAIQSGIKALKLIAIHLATTELLNEKVAQGEKKGWLGKYLARVKESDINEDDLNAILNRANQKLGLSDSSKIGKDFFLENKGRRKSTLVKHLGKAAQVFSQKKIEQMKVSQVNVSVKPTLPSRENKPQNKGPMFKELVERKAEKKNTEPAEFDRSNNTKLEENRPDRSNKTVERDEAAWRPYLSNQEDVEKQLKGFTRDQLDLRQVWNRANVKTSYDNEEGLKALLGGFSEKQLEAYVIDLANAGRHDDITYVTQLWSELNADKVQKTKPERKADVLLGKLRKKAKQNLSNFAKKLVPESILKQYEKGKIKRKVDRLVSQYNDDLRNVSLREKALNNLKGLRKLDSDLCDIVVAKLVERLALQYNYELGDVSSRENALSDLKGLRNLDDDFYDTIVVKLTEIEGLIVPYDVVEELINAMVPPGQKPIEVDDLNVELGDQNLESSINKAYNATTDVLKIFYDFRSLPDSETNAHSSGFWIDLTTSINQLEAYLLNIESQVKGEVANNKDFKLEDGLLEELQGVFSSISGIRSEMERITSDDILTPPVEKTLHDIESSVRATFEELNKNNKKSTSVRDEISQKDTLLKEEAVEISQVKDRKPPTQADPESTQVTKPKITKDAEQKQKTSVSVGQVVNLGTHVESLLDAIAEDRASDVKAALGDMLDLAKVDGKTIIKEIAKLEINEIESDLFAFKDQGIDLLLLELKKEVLREMGGAAPLWAQASK